MSEGMDYNQQIGQLQRALRERELHRLDLEKENLSKIQRREKRHKQLRSRIKALHKELVQEEIESTQRVTLLLSRVDAVRREHELLEARTERLRQKKRQYELLLSNSSLDSLPQGSPAYGLCSLRGADSVKLRVQPHAGLALRPSQQQFVSQQYQQYPYDASTSMSPIQQNSTQVTFQNTNNIAQTFSDQMINSAPKIPHHLLSNGSRTASMAHNNYGVPNSASMAHNNHGVPNSDQSSTTTTQFQGKLSESLEHRQLQLGAHSDTNLPLGGFNQRMFGAGNTIDSTVSLNSSVTDRNTDHSLIVMERITDMQQKASANHSSMSSNLGGASDDCQVRAPYFRKHEDMTERITDRITNSPSLAVLRDSSEMLSQRQRTEALIPEGCYQPPQQENHSQSSMLSEPPLERHASLSDMVQMSLHSEHPQTSSLPGHSPETPTLPQHQQKSSVSPIDNSSQPQRVSEASLTERLHQSREITLPVVDPDPREQELYLEENYGHSGKHSASEESSSSTAGREIDAPQDYSPLNRDQYLLCQRSANGYNTGSLHVDHEVPTLPICVKEEYDGRNTVDSSSRSDRTASCQPATSVNNREQQQEPLHGPSESADEPQSLDATSRSEPLLSEGRDTDNEGAIHRNESAIRGESGTGRLPEGHGHPISSLSSTEKSDSGSPVLREVSPSDCPPQTNSRLKGLDDARASNWKSDEPAILGHIDAPKSVTFGAYKKDEDDDSDFFDRSVAPVTASRAYKNLLGDMSIGGGTATGMESDNDDIEAQMSSLAVKDSPGKSAAFRPFSSGIPSLRPAAPGTDTDSVDSVEAAIQAAMNKPKQGTEKITEEEPQKSTQPATVPSKSLTSFQEKEMVAKTTAGKAGVGKPKASAALNLKLDSDSESYGVSGGDNESEDDFDFYD